MSLIPYNPIDGAVADWLKAKSAKSGSAKTEKAYTETMADFRAALAERNADLLSDPALVNMVAEQWANDSKKGKAVRPATFNQRLAIVSSFYVYYGKKAALTGKHIPNPISAVGRHEVQAYSGALPMSAEELAKRLKAIDRSIPQGKRDYAMLWLFLVTGRRLSEVTRLTRADLVLGEKILVNFKTKGGKKMSDKLEGEALAALLDWLHTYYGDDLTAIPGISPLWTDLSHGAKGQIKGVSTMTVSNICKKRLGTSKVHTLRHTFAAAMERVNAPLSEIQHRLGHESAATTGIYLKQLRAADNPYASALDKLFSTED